MAESFAQLQTVIRARDAESARLLEGKFLSLSLPLRPFRPNRGEQATLLVDQVGIKTYVKKPKPRGPAGFGHLLKGHTAVSAMTMEVVSRLFAVAVGEPYASLVRPTAVRKEDRFGWVVVSQWRDGLMIAPDELRIVDEDAWRAAAFFDALTRQQDRHAANLTHSPAEGLALFDHGFSFPLPLVPPGANQLAASRRRDRKERQLAAAERALLVRVRDDATLFGLAPFLGPVRSWALRRRADKMALRGFL